MIILLPGCPRWSRSVRGSWSRSGVETHRQTLKEHFDNDLDKLNWRYFSPIFYPNPTMYLSFLSPRTGTQTQQCQCTVSGKLTTQWVFPPALPVNTTKCNFKSQTFATFIKMTQSGIKARNSRRGSEIKDISLSVQTASGNGAKKHFLLICKDCVFRPTQLSQVQKVSGEISKRMRRG